MRADYVWDTASLGEKEWEVGGGVGGSDFSLAGLG